MAVRAFAPGRVNLIGEHTDYNDGLCLPFAIERGITVTAEPLDGERFEVTAADLGEEDSFELGEEDVFEPGRRPAGGCLATYPPYRRQTRQAPLSSSGWRAFARGMVAELGAAGHRLRGARLVVESDLPRGAGLSSSAALEVALALALLAIAGDDEPDRVELARLCSRVENDWVGAQTGLLDQLAVLLGREGHALRLDLRGLAREPVQPALEPVPLELGDWTLATLDSGARRAHAESGYNERREECRRACRELGVQSLRDATLAGAERLPAPLDRRVRHVVTENERVERAVEALPDGDLPEIGRLLDASHASLRDDYEVSAPEVERTVEACKDAGAAGARVVGGGFGGSVLALFGPGARPPDGALAVGPAAAARLLG